MARRSSEACETLRRHIDGTGTNLKRRSLRRSTTPRDPTATDAAVGTRRRVTSAIREEPS